MDLETAHRQAVGAAVAGVQDAALGRARLAGPPDVVAVVADAAVSSATPFLRAPLLSRISHAAALHPTQGPECPTCNAPAPCATAVELGR